LGAETILFLCCKNINIKIKEVKSMSTRKRKTEPKPKKKCSSCEESQSTTKFYKVKSTMFPDGMINICRDCVVKQVNLEDMDSVIGFLRQIDKPYIQKHWEESLTNKLGRYPLGEYIRKLNSLHQLKDKTFDNSDGINGVGKIDLQTAKTPNEIENIKGEKITYSDELVDKWGTGYTKNEYLQMEKFYQDTKLSHEIHTSTHYDLLRQLSYLSVDRDRLRRADDWGNYSKLSKTIEDMTKSAGFRPVDRQGLDDSTGIKSFSQIFEEVEKRGFRKPPTVVFNEDIVDAMIVSLANYYNRLVGAKILSEIPDDIKDDLDDFYELDETPVEINDEDYDDIDFSLEEEIEVDIDDKQVE
jgi:hypothetical protein